jgi:hypothetical protein
LHKRAGCRPVHFGGAMRCISRPRHRCKNSRTGQMRGSIPWHKVSRSKNTCITFFHREKTQRLSCFSMAPMTRISATCISGEVHNRSPLPGSTLMEDLRFTTGALLFRTLSICCGMRNRYIFAEYRKVPIIHVFQQLRSLWAKKKVKSFSQGKHNVRSIAAIIAVADFTDRDRRVCP